MEMTTEEQQAYDWALKQQYQSVAADYARILAKYIQRQDESEERLPELDLARSLRVAVVQQQYGLGNLTEEQARVVLSGPLVPEDDTTIVDDSDELVVSAVRASGGGHE